MGNYRFYFLSFSTFYEEGGLIEIGASRLFILKQIEQQQQVEINMELC